MNWSKSLATNVQGAFSFALAHVHLIATCFCHLVLLTAPGLLGVFQSHLLSAHPIRRRFLNLS